MKTKIFKTIILFSLLLTFSCNNDDSQTETAVEFIEIGKGALFGNGEEGISQSNMVISNTNDWQNLISQMDSVNITSDEFTEININFDDFTVFAIFLELKGSGWWLEMESIVENGDTIFITYEERISLVSIITQPFHIIKIPKTDKTIKVELKNAL